MTFCSSNTTATATVVAQTQLLIQMLHSNGWLVVAAARYHSNGRHLTSWYLFVHELQSIPQASTGRPQNKPWAPEWWIVYTYDG